MNYAGIVDIGLVSVKAQRAVWETVGVMRRRSAILVNGLRLTPVTGVESLRAWSK